MSSKSAALASWFSPQARLRTCQGWAAERFLDPKSRGEIPSELSVEAFQAQGFDAQDLAAQPRYNGSWFSPVELALWSGRADLLAAMAPLLQEQAFAPAPDESIVPLATFALDPDLDALEAMRAALGDDRLRALMTRPAGPDRNTPLHALACASDGKRATLALAVIDRLELLELDLPNNQGVTPLMLAAQRQRAAMCAGLLDRGADPDLENAYGSSALSLAADWAALDQGAASSVFEALDMRRFLEKIQSAKPDEADSSPKPSAARKARL